jgi:hypothetical protein
VALVVAVAQLEEFTPVLATDLQGWVSFMVLTTTGLLLVLRRGRPFTMTGIMCPLNLAWRPGSVNAEIASGLFLSEAIVKTHIARILANLALRTGCTRWCSPTSTGSSDPGGSEGNAVRPTRVDLYSKTGRLAAECSGREPAG